MIELDECPGDGGGPSTGEDVTFLPNMGLLVRQREKIWAIDLKYFFNSTKVSALRSSWANTLRWVSTDLRKVAAKRRKRERAGQPTVRSRNISAWRETLLSHLPTVSQTPVFGIFGAESVILHGFRPITRNCFPNIGHIAGSARYSRNIQGGYC